jgi:hypothetical protein
MLIEVELVDGEMTKVLQQGLDRLIEKNLVKRFKRHSGWAYVGIDPIRSKHNTYEQLFDGPERRNPYSKTHIYH